MLRILALGYDRSFFCQRPVAQWLVFKTIYARRIGSEFDPSDYILHRLENCTICTIQSNHLKLAYLLLPIIQNKWTFSLIGRLFEIEYLSTSWHPIFSPI